MKRTFYPDAAHGWLQVPRSDLQRLNIEAEITVYSYQSGDLVYLEEDQDCTTYLKAAEAAGWNVEIDHAESVDYSRIRGLPSYRQLENNFPDSN
jgi:hypothetical protein